MVGWHHQLLELVMDREAWHAAVYVVAESWTIKKAECQRIDAFDGGAGEDSCESPGLQGDPTSPS